jgi:transcription antitermination factor NusG
LTELKIGDRVTVKRPYGSHVGVAELEVGAFGASGGVHVGLIGHDRTKHHDDKNGSLFYYTKDVTKLEKPALQIGDKVIVDLDMPSSSWHKVEGVVTGLCTYNPDTTAKVRVTKNGPNSTARVGLETTLVNLTKLEQHTEFAVGDKVKVGYHAPHNGREGTVTVVHDRRSWPFEVKFDDAEGGVATGIYHATELSKVVPAKFAKGDKVTVLKNAMCVAEGLTGVVLEQNSTGYVVANIKGEPIRLHFLPKELELTKTVVPVLKVGDFVTFDRKGNKHWQGGRGRIEKIDHWHGVVLLEAPPLNELYKAGNRVSVHASELKLLKGNPFRVGDSVKTEGYNSEIWNNRPGVIDRSGLGRTSIVNFTDGKFPDSGGFDAKYLVPRKPDVKPVEKPKPVEPVFKVGDRVTIKASYGPGPFVGRTGKVLDTYDDTNTHVRVKFEDTKKCPEGTFLTKFVEAATTPEPLEFKKGDIVKPKPGAFIYTAHKGAVYLIVDEVIPFNRHKYVVRVLGKQGGGHAYLPDELEAGEQLTQWEIELLDSPAVKLPEPVGYAKGGKIAKAEAVDGPAHYGGKDNPYEVIKVAEAWGFEKNAYLFNALKYLGRAGKKGNKVEDLKKLVFYVQREIALEEAK